MSHETLELYAKGCDYGSPLACAVLGALYSGRGSVPAEPERSAARLRRECHLRPAGGGCAAAAEAFARGDPGVLNAVVVTELFGTACESGDETLCAEVEAFMRDARPAVADSARGILRRVCLKTPLSSCADTKSPPDGNAQRK